MSTSKMPSGIPSAQAIDKEQVKLLRFSTEEESILKEPKLLVQALNQTLKFSLNHTMETDTK